MSISVVIATHNRASLLAATLAQLRRQHCEPDDEVIVVDNASTDGTAAVVARAADGFPVRLRYAREPTPGKTAALNTGLAIACGDLLALTDDDVLVADDWIATIRRLFADASRELVGGRVDPLWERAAPRWLRVDGACGYNQLASPLALLHYGEAQDLGARTAVGANLVMRRTVHDALGGFAPHLGRHRGTLLSGEDHDFCLRARAAGRRCEYRPELTVRHFVPAGRMTLRYYARWFYWSGVTNALLDMAAPSEGERLVPRYLVKRIVAAPLSSLALLAARRSADAALQALQGVFAVGYIGARIRSRLVRRRAAGPGSQSLGSPGRNRTRRGAFNAWHSRRGLSRP
jgi:GT2 family glycosyltransferase